MSIAIEIQKKPKYDKKIQLRTASEVFELEEVQEIKDAIQEHLFFIGLDRRNNVRNISLLGVGTSAEINIEAKDIVRTALINACDRVILVHNHPSNNLEPSKTDLIMTNTINKLLNVFNIKLLDHIIVNENDYISMSEVHAIYDDYENDKIKLLDKTLLIEENRILRKKLKRINKLEKNEEEEDEVE